MASFSVSRNARLPGPFAGLLLSLLLLCATQVALSQNRPPIVPLRYAEDYSYLADASKRTEAWDSVKFIRLSDADAPLSFLSLGAGLRQMYERFENPDGAVRQWLPTRVMAHADLRFRENRWRAFGQLASATLLNDEMPRPIDVNRLFVLNLFAEARLAKLGSEDAGDELRLRAGRMELNYGAARLITIREGPNARQYWDGGQLMLRRGAWRVDALVAEAGVIGNPGVFDDDVFESDQLLWGLYATRERKPGGGDTRTLDVYYLGLEDDARAFFNFSGAETRHTGGVRLAGQAGPLLYDYEVMGQVGSAGQQDIRAFGLGTRTEYALTPAPQPGQRGGLVTTGFTLGLMVDYWSGDRDSADNRLNNFNAPYPRQGYYRGAGQLYPSNFADVSAYLEAGFPQGLTASVGYTHYWRTSIEDGVYVAGVGRPVLPPRPGVDGRELGGQLDFSASLAVGRHFSISGKYSRFWAAGFVEASPNPQEVRHFFNIRAGYRI